MIDAISIVDRLPAPDADKAAFMQELCDALTAEMTARGCPGGDIEDVIWHPAEDGRDVAVVIASPCVGGFDGMNAGRCRAILKDRLARQRAAAEAAQAEGRLL